MTSPKPTSRKIEKLDMYEIYDKAWEDVPENVEDQHHWVYLQMLTIVIDEFNQMVDVINNLTKDEK